MFFCYVSYYYTLYLFAGNQSNHQNFEKSLVSHKLWLIWKRAKNTKKSVLAIFQAYVGQPDGHIGWATSLFFRRPFLCLFSKKYFFLLHPFSNQSQFMGYQGWVEILMITLISSKKLEEYKIMRHTVRTFVIVPKYLHGTYLVLMSYILTYNL